MVMAIRQRLFWLMIVILMGLTIYGLLTWLLLIEKAYAAEGAYCVRYADQATSDFILRLNDTKTQDFIRTRLWTTCLNSDEAPDLPKDVMQTLQIIRPDAGGGACPTPSEPRSSAATIPKRVSRPNVEPVQALCSNAKMRTVYQTGTAHWTCQR